MNGVIPAIYEKGVFRPLIKPTVLAEHQQVQLFFVPAEDEIVPEALPVEERLRFVRETMGTWHIPDPQFRRWLAEEASLYDA